MNTINRATHREENGRVSINQGWTPSGVMNCLAAYEDTGLTPEEISKWKEALGKFTSVTGDRILQIVNAEQEGRLVVLPCKVGTDVWSSCFTKVLDDGTEIPTMWSFGLAMMEDWGKFWHLSRAEAEKALEVSEDA